LTPWGCAPKTLGHNRGTSARRGCQKNRFVNAGAAAIPTAKKEIWLIHYDDIRVGSIVVRQDQWSRRVRFDSATHRGRQRIAK
jgi:hypothetical protein